MSVIRPTAVAGTFYPANPAELDRQLEGFLAAIHVPSHEPIPKAIIVPHAGYVYSGPIAATAYARIKAGQGTIKRVVLIGPSHRVAFRGMAIAQANQWATPWGNVPVDSAALPALANVPMMGFLDQAHAAEHSLEVQLPFILKCLGEIAIVPIVVGECPAEAVAAALEALWGGPETLIVASTDLSHFLDYATCQKTDRITAAAIESFDGARISGDGACGHFPLAGLLTVAARRSMSIRAFDIRNSGDTAGPKDRVVGYGAWGLYEHPLRAYTPDLVQLAKSAIQYGLETGQVMPAPQTGPEILFQPGAVFVTLKRQGNLRGCVGSIMARRPLGVDIVENAFHSAFHDNRFPPLTLAEFGDISLSVTVITPSEPMTFSSEAQFIAQLRPNLDGLRIEDQGRQALFIPSVWQSLPKPKDFVAHLKLKAGLTADHWSPTFQAWRFQAVELL